jgi:hypothetical protein
MSRYQTIKKPKLKRITVLVTENNNRGINKFMTDFINETQESMSYAEALNWLLYFGISDWFREAIDDLRKEFYKVWAGSESHKKYTTAIDEFDFIEFIQKKRNEKRPNE